MKIGLGKEDCESCVKTEHLRKELAFRIQYVPNCLAMRRLVLIAAFIGICSGLRCFVDHHATASVDCGPHSGCIKVSERNITKLNTKSWYSWYVYSPTNFLNFALKIYGNFSLQVRSIYHCAYWNRTETRLLHSPCSRSMFWSRRQIDLLLVHVEWFLQPFCQSSFWFENPLDFRLHCDNNENKVDRTLDIEGHHLIHIKGLRSWLFVAPLVRSQMCNKFCGNFTHPNQQNPKFLSTWFKADACPYASWRVSKT